MCPGPRGLSPLLLGTNGHRSWPAVSHHRRQRETRPTISHARRISTSVSACARHHIFISSSTCHQISVCPHRLWNRHRRRQWDPPLWVLLSSRTTRPTTTRSTTIARSALDVGGGYTTTRRGGRAAVGEEDVSLRMLRDREAVVRIGWICARWSEVKTEQNRGGCI